MFGILERYLSPFISFSTAYKLILFILLLFLVFLSSNYDFYSSNMFAMVFHTIHSFLK